MSCTIRSGTTSNSDICNAEAVLKKLYNDFTLVQLGDNASFKTPNPDTFTTLNANPATFLKILTSGGDVFKTVDTLPIMDNNTKIKNQMKNMLLNNTVTASSIDVYPAPPQTDFTTPTNFKGIYGLINAVNLLKIKINTEIISKISSGSGNSISIDDSTAERLEYINTFYEKKNAKDTIEEISYRENEIYRERFLNIILILVGIYIVGTQLRERYFSNVSVFGGLFSGFGNGLGSTNISSLFSSNAYTLKSR
jgi:hypothetical protein